MPTLYIGNKNYSSWSMRPWVLMRQVGIAFEEVILRFDGFEHASNFKQQATGLTPAGRVPVLVADDIVVWVSLAICEYLADKYPDKNLWPNTLAHRARARSLCAEIHSGFQALRSACPMNIEAQLPHVGAQLWEENSALREDMARLEAMWAPVLAASAGPMLFDTFGIVDAYLAPICIRIATYSLPGSAGLDVYARRLRTLPSVQEWMQGALAEHDFLQFEEPYRHAANELPTE